MVFAVIEEKNKILNVLCQALPNSKGLKCKTERVVIFGINLESWRTFL
jgi:hypothetical protein